MIFRSQSIRPNLPKEMRQQFLIKTNKKILNKTEISNLFLHSLQGQFWGFHFLIAFLKALKKLESFMGSFGTKPQIFSPRWGKISVLSVYVWSREFWAENSEYWTLRFEKISVNMIGARSLFTLKISVVKTCRFRIWFGADLRF